MEEATRKNLIFLVTALLAVLMGVALGVGLIMTWPRLAKTPPTATATTCTLDPQTAATLAAIKESTSTSQEEVDTLRVVIADLIDRLESRPAAGGGAGPDNLPSAYVRQVNDFFRTATAKTLLSSRAEGARLGDPSFVDWDLISVPYTISGKSQYLLVKIKILDFYDLQFDVLWDSLEGGR
jgi:hypothetical protein